MLQLPKQIKVRCPNCNNVELLANQSPTIRQHKVLLACNRCRAEMHITEKQVEEWKEKANELYTQGIKKK